MAPHALAHEHDTAQRASSLHHFGRKIGNTVRCNARTSEQRNAYNAWNHVAASRREAGPSRSFTRNEGSSCLVLTSHCGCVAPVMPTARAVCLRDDEIHFKNCDCKPVAGAQLVKNCPLGLGVGADDFDTRVQHIACFLRHRLDAEGYKEDASLEKKKNASNMKYLFTYGLCMRPRSQKTCATPNSIIMCHVGPAAVELGSARKIHNKAISIKVKHA